MIWAGATIMTALCTAIDVVIARVALGFGEGATFPTATRACNTGRPRPGAASPRALPRLRPAGNAVTPP